MLSKTIENAGLPQACSRGTRNSCGAGSKKNHSEIFQKIMHENTKMMRTPQKLLTVWIEDDLARMKTLISTSDLIGGIVDDALKYLAIQTEITKIECWRKSPSVLLRLDHTALDYGIKNNEVFILKSSSSNNKISL